MRILISAGEASGEMYGAQLIEALRRHDPRIECFGAGGPAMRAVGCDTVVDANDLSVVGISEIASHLPKIFGLFRRLIREGDQRTPDIAVVIDSPAFNWRVAREMKKRGIPVVYYVCPQFWAWRQGRVRLLRKYVDKALVIFPFEEKFYRDRGVDATFVGHPLAHIQKPAITRRDYAARYKLNASKHWIALLPGSRIKEVKMNLPVMLASAERLGQKYEFILPVARTLSATFLRSLLGERTTKLVEDALPALAHSRAGIIASGTATVEAALMELPFITIYRVSALTYFLGRNRVKVPYFSMVNLIAQKRVVPELLQQDFTVDKVVQNVNRIIEDGDPRDEMLHGLEEVRELLGKADHELSAPELASRQILSLVKDKAPQITPGSPQ